LLKAGFAGSTRIRTEVLGVKVPRHNQLDYKTTDTDDGGRTHDRLVKSQTLYQLSYNGRGELIQLSTHLEFDGFKPSNFGDFWGKTGCSVVIFIVFLFFFYFLFFLLFMVFLFFLFFLKKYSCWDLNPEPPAHRRLCT